MPNAFPAQSNATRFRFALNNSKVSAGDPPFYDVIDGGGSMNSAGFVGSCSGDKIGEVRFDPIMKRWGFVISQLRFANLTPAGIDPGSSDAALISNFIATLAVPSNIVLQ